VTRLDLFSSETFATATENLNVPVVRLPDCLMPPALRDHSVVLQALLGFYTPTLNIKYIPASWMLESMLASRESNRALMLVENSSGNFALALALCARKHGLEVTAIVADNIAAGKLSPLQASGVHVLKESEAIVKLGLRETCGGVRIAELLAEQEGWINLGQYSNPTNPESYCHLLMPEILRSSAGNIRVFGAALGSTGTMVGLGGSLRKAIPGMRTVGAIPHLGQDIPGCRDDNRLREVRFEWRSCVDYKCYVSAVDAFRASLQMWAAGIPAGPSAGAAFLAVCDFLIREKNDNRLDGYAAADGSIYAMFVCADTLYPYFQQAKEYCPEQFGETPQLFHPAAPALVPDLAPELAG